MFNLNNNTRPQFAFGNQAAFAMTNIAKNNADMNDERPLVSSVKPMLLVLEESVSQFQSHESSRYILCGNKCAQIMYSSINN